MDVKVVEIDRKSEGRSKQNKSKNYNKEIEKENGYLSLYSKTKPPLPMFRK